jgi:hypothetical protein
LLDCEKKLSREILYGQRVQDAMRCDVVQGSAVLGRAG